MNHITYGLGNKASSIWETIRVRNPSHNDILLEMRSKQELSALFSKSSKEYSKDLALDAVLLETMAWRIYMFGESNKFAITPSTQGEYFKRMRNDPHFHKYRDSSNLRHGTSGCKSIERLFPPRGVFVEFSGIHSYWYTLSMEGNRTVKRIIGSPKCLNPKCNHEGDKHATKWLKGIIRSEWEANLLNKHKY